MAMKKLMAAATALLIVAALGWVGSLDYQDQIRERDRYCEMVRNGAWPDYRGTYASECAPNDPPARLGKRSAPID